MGISIEYINSIKNNDPAITHVRIQHAIYPKDGCALAEALKENTHVSSVDLAYARIGDEGACALAEVLKTNRTLINLHLAANDIGDKGARALAEALKTNSTLNKLSLVSNSIGKETMLAFAETLKTNKNITKLHLDYSCTGCSSTPALVEVLLKSKNIIDAHLGLENPEKLKKHCEKNKLDAAMSILGTIKGRHWNKDQLVDISERIPAIIEVYSDSGTEQEFHRFQKQIAGILKKLQKDAFTSNRVDIKLPEWLQDLSTPERGRE